MGKNRSKGEMTSKERVEKFDKYFHDPDQFHKIFSELGFSYVDDGCTGACECCERKDTCDTYAEIKGKIDKDHSRSEPEGGGR